MTSTASPGVVVMRPVRRTDLVGGILCTTVPAMIVTGVFAVGDDRLPAAVLLTGAMVVEAAVAAVLLLRMRIVLDRDGALLRRLLTGSSRLLRGSVRSAAFRTVYASGSLDKRLHLFLLDAAGAPLLRLTDLWWRPADLAAVAQHFEVPVETVTDTLSPDELRRFAPGRLHWWERHPVLGGAAMLAGVALGSAAFARAVGLAI